MVQTQSFEADTLAALVAAVNTFLATLAERHILDIIVTTTQAGKYGTKQNYLATVVFKVMP